MVVAILFTHSLMDDVYLTVVPKNQTLENIKMTLHNWDMTGTSTERIQISFELNDAEFAPSNQNGSSIEGNIEIGYLKEIILKDKEYVALLKENERLA